MTAKERYEKLEEYLSAENPVLLEVIREYRRLDEVAFGIGVGLAAAAGALLAPVFLVWAESGSVPTMKGRSKTKWTCEA